MVKCYAAKERGGNMKKHSKGTRIAAYIIFALVVAGMIILCVFGVKWTISAINWIKGIVEQLIS